MSSSNQIKNVVIFSGSSEGDGAYVSLAKDLGRSLAVNGFTLVNGGGPGLMDTVAKSAFEQGGKVIGVHFEHEGRNPSKYNTETLKYKELFPRQQKIISLADAFVVLPGGLGTLYELVEVLVKKYLLEIGTAVPVLLLSEEFWRPFMEMAKLQEKRKFIGEKVMSSFKIVDSVDEVLMELKQNPETQQVEKQRERWNGRAGKWDDEIKSSSHYANFEDGYQKFLDLETRILADMHHVKTAIDLGCGTGQTSALLVGKVGEIYILDIAEEMLKEAQKKVPQAIPLCAPVTSIPLPDKSVDLAISRGIVLSHLPENLTANFFSELGRIVRSGGKIIFDYLSNPDTASYKNESPKIPFTMKNINESLEAQGFINIIFDGEAKNRVVRVSADKI